MGCSLPCPPLIDRHESQRTLGTSAISSRFLSKTARWRSRQRALPEEEDAQDETARS